MGQNDSASNAIPDEKPWQRIDVAAPCSASWDAMTGDEKKRFCGDCKLHVYNLSAMSDAEVDKLWENKNGKVCVRFYQRKDGTVLTDNCPVGLRKLRDTARHACRVAATFLALALSWTAAFAGTPKSDKADGPKCQKSQSGQDNDKNRELMGKPMAPSPDRPVMGAAPPMPVKMGEMMAPQPSPDRTSFIKAAQTALSNQIKVPPGSKADLSKLQMQIQIDRHGKVAQAHIVDATSGAIATSGDAKLDAKLLEMAKGTKPGKPPTGDADDLIAIEVPLAPPRKTP